MPDTRSTRQVTVIPNIPEGLRRCTGCLTLIFPKGLISVEPVPVPLEYLELVHTPSYIEKVLKTADHDFTSLAPDTPASSKSYLSAWLAVGGCMKGLDSLISGECGRLLCAGASTGSSCVARPRRRLLYFQQSGDNSPVCDKTISDSANPDH